MTAAKEQQHGDRLTKLNKYRFRAFPTAAIYGGNASGKTNFFKAINFAKHFIIKGSLPYYQINIEPFLLDDDSRNKPSVFILDILVEDDIYEYSFSLITKEVPFQLY